MEFEALLEDCIAAILSRTTPLDVCTLSSVSKMFCSAADSDAVWARFLPPDSQLSSIISHSPSLANTPSKKSLYLALSDIPIIIHQGTQSFQLERKSGKSVACLVPELSTLFWFPEVAELCDVCWLEIRGMINTQALSPNTQYAAFLVFKMIGSRGFRKGHAKLSVGDGSGHSSTNIACLDPNVNGGLQRPSVRSDGWLEIEMGEFFNSSIEDEQMQMSVLELGAYWKNGLFLEGIEVRPKGDN